LRAVLRCGAFCYVAASMHRVFTLVLAALVGSSTPALAQQSGMAPQTTDQRLTSAEGEIQSLWRSYFAVVRDDLPNTKGSVDCSTGRYEEIKPTNSYLVFFVACERIEPHSTGYRATIAIGNPHTFGFSRVNGTLSYGENVAAALVRDNQRVTFSTESELRPGTWTRIQVPIASTEAKDVSKIIVEFEAGGAFARSGGDPGRPTGTAGIPLLGRR
jgi:hypothetical protein